MLLLQASANGSLLTAGARFRFAAMDGVSGDRARRSQLVKRPAPCRGLSAGAIEIIRPRGLARGFNRPRPGPSPESVGGPSRTSVAHVASNRSRPDGVSDAAAVSPLPECLIDFQSRHCIALHRLHRALLVPLPDSLLKYLQTCACGAAGLIPQGDPPLTGKLLQRTKKSRWCL